MLLEYYNLGEEPFGVTPDPRFLVETREHKEALASLQYGIHSGRGFVSLIAAPGTGKTTLLFQLLEGIRGKARTAFLFHTPRDYRALMLSLLAELQCDTPEPRIV